MELILFAIAVEKGFILMIKDNIIKLSLIILTLAHLSGPPLAYAPVQREYRVEMLQQRVDRLLKWKLKGIMRGWKLDGDKTIWR